MIILGTKLNVVDNSGSKIAKCIKVLNKKKAATIGSIILVSLKKFANRRKVKKRIIYVGLIIGIKTWVNRLDGVVIKFFSNRLLLFNKQFKFLGTRIYGILLKEVKVKNLKEKKYKNYFHKIITYTSLMI